jgi:hypothetical protein
LSRDSHLIVAHIGLRRMRKGLLGDLSTLVKTAKKLQETLQITDTSVPVFEYLDDLVLQSFKLATRAVRFLDIWATDSVSPAFELPNASTQRPLTPPESADAAVQPLSANRAGDDSTLASDNGVQVTQTPEIAHANLNVTGTQPSRNPHRFSVAFSIPSDADSPQLPTATPQTQVQAKRISITHRLSYTSTSPVTYNGRLTSERLNAAHDSFLGFIGSFIGLHLHSRSSEELAQITRQSVAACRQLLIVVEEVWERDSRRSKQLEDVRDTMYARLSELVQATKDLFTASDNDISEEVFAPESGKQLVAAATSCVRSAGDCVAKARLVIERIGDFEFEPAGLGISESIIEHGGQEPADDATTLKQPESTLETDKPLPAPPTEEQQLLLPEATSEMKPLPEIPPPSPPDKTSAPQLAQPATAVVPSTEASVRSSRSSLTPLARLQTSILPESSLPEEVVSSATAPKSGRSDSVNVSLTDSNSTFHYSMRGDTGSFVSHTSTRATTPDNLPSKKISAHTLISSFGSSSELHSLASEDFAAGEEHLLETSYVHELIYNKEGQISGGSLPALVEQLTTHESTPDVVFVTAFYLTFRLFTTPAEFTRCLIDRFDYIGNSQAVGVPVRLRVYNVFKGWMESHWSPDSDSEALGLILSFATGKLRASLPAAGKRLAELTSKVTEVRAGALVPRLVSAIGTSTMTLTHSEGNLPSAVVSKSQLNHLRAGNEGRAQCSILDFDPLELARQFTLIESKLFCSIQPEELLALEWTKKSDSKAVNVKAMSTLSTDLANLVADTILQLEDAKRRAVMIKQWVKIAGKCLELNNYDSLMAIICSLNSSMVMRLKKTWEVVSSKTKARLEELKAITDVGRNYAVLRQRLHNHVAPCIPFVGIYLTDLTFIDVGNGTTRQLPGDSGREGASVINFDKHMKTAKIINQLQSFQVPYRLAGVPEMQDWMEAQIQRVRSSDESNIQSYYRRSLLLEPRELQPSLRGSPSLDNTAQSIITAETRTTRDKFDFLNFNFSTHGVKGA